MLICFSTTEIRLVITKKVLLLQKYFHYFIMPAVQIESNSIYHNLSWAIPVSRFWLLGDHSSNSSWYFNQTTPRICHLGSILSSEHPCPAGLVVSTALGTTKEPPGPEQHSRAQGIPLPRWKWLLLTWSCPLGSPGEVRTHCTDRFYITRYCTLTQPQNQGNKPKQKTQNLKFCSNFPFSTGQGELRVEQEWATCFSHVTLSNFCLNTEIRTEGPLGAVTATSSATVPAAAVFELLMCLTTDLHSTLHAPDVLGFPNTSVLNHTKPGLSNVHTPLPDTASSSRARDLWGSCWGLRVYYKYSSNQKILKIINSVKLSSLLMSNGKI